MKVGDSYKVYIEVAPGHFEPVATAAIKRIDKDDNQVQLIVPATLVIMDTKVEIDTTPAAALETNQHVLLGTENADGVVNNSDGTDTQPVITGTPEAVTAPTVAPTSAAVGTGETNQTVVPTPIENSSVETVVPDSSATPVADATGISTTPSTE